MNYFSYVKSMNVTNALKIYEVVRNLKGYAMTIYKSLWEDALDKSFFHILYNYDESSGGDLEHYATRVVGTILLGKYNHEVEHEISLNNAMDLKSLDATELNPLDVFLEKEENGVSNDLSNCIEYLSHMFIKDYRFFKTQRAEHRRLSYAGLFEMYSEATVSKAMKYLLEKYSEPMDKLYALSKATRFRNFPEDRYKKNMDANVVYEGMFNNILMYSLSGTKRSKFFYSFNIRSAVLSLIQMYYLCEDSICAVKVEGIDVFCSLSGNMVEGLEELYSTLERELIGALLAKLPHLGVIRYEKGVNLLLSSPKECEGGLVLEIFGFSFKMELVKVVSKKVGKKVY